MILLLKYFLDFLSLITIGMCLMLKVPQISILLNTKSAVGISLTSLILELCGYVLLTSTLFFTRFFTQNLFLTYMTYVSFQLFCNLNV